MKKTILVSMFSLILISVSCKKKDEVKQDPRTPPDLVFKTGGNYVSSNFTATQQDTLLIGLIATKTEDELSSFNASVAYDGSATTTTFFNHTLNGGEFGGYSADVTYITRAQTGSEVLTFSIVDRDGNITTKSITVNVP